MECKNKIDEIIGMIGRNDLNFQELKNFIEIIFYDEDFLGRYSFSDLKFKSENSKSLGELIEIILGLNEAVLKYILPTYKYCYFHQVTRGNQEIEVIKQESLEGVGSFGLDLGENSGILFEKRNGRLFMKQNGSNSRLIGVRITRKTLENFSIFIIGDDLLQINRLENERISLSLFKNYHEESKLTYDISKTNFIIGRSEAASIKLQSNLVSTKHAFIKRDSKGQWHIIDNKSKNAVYFCCHTNKSLLNFGSNEIELFDGDEFSNGSFKAKVRFLYEEL